MQWVAIGSVVAVSGYGVAVFARADRAALGGTGWLLLGGGALLMAITAYHIATSVTVVDAQGVRQSWFIPRDVKWDDIFYARLRPLPFSKRLMLVTKRGRFVQFNSGSAELDAAFAAIARRYPKQ